MSIALQICFLEWPMMGGFGSYTDHLDSRLAMGDDADKDQCDLRNTDKRGVEARQNFEDEQHNVAKQYDGSTSGNGGSDGSDDDDDDGGGDYESNSHSIIKKNPFALLSDENE
ncbi:hypothetical protein BSLG_004900 [Batrachochytrium salamandrivorans]|nr:hypothetical protein BSLG_004900 [Batrachochytrium salamandrivorans]